MLSSIQVAARVVSDTIPAAFGHIYVDIAAWMLATAAFLWLSSRYSKKDKQ